MEKSFERLINWHGFISHCFMRKGRMARGILPDSQRFRTERGFEISQRMKRLKGGLPAFFVEGLWDELLLPFFLGSRCRFHSGVIRKEGPWA